jgi:hypothetical protein
MKKILVLTAILAFAASNSFAGGASGTTGTIDFATTGQEVHADLTGGTASADTTLIGKCSSGVDVAWFVSDLGYSLMTQNKQGTRAYGTSYDSTQMYQTVAADANPGTPVYGGGSLTAIDTTDFDNAEWKAL